MYSLFTVWVQSSGYWALQTVAKWHRANWLCWSQGVHCFCNTDRLEGGKIFVACHAAELAMLVAGLPWLRIRSQAEAVQVAVSICFAEWTCLISAANAISYEHLLALTLAYVKRGDAEEGGEIWAGFCACFRNMLSVQYSRMSLLRVPDVRDESWRGDQPQL